MTGPRWRRWPLFTLIAVLIVTGCALGYDAASAALAHQPPVTVALTGAAPIRAEVANTPAAREHGLMDRDRVPTGTGMLFEFDAPGRVAFWMKNTTVPLDIAWIHNRVVVAVVTMPPCPASVGENCPRFTPPVAADSAVETAAGALAGVHPGARVSLHR